MTLSDLAMQLRATGKRLQRDGWYDPAKVFLGRSNPGSVQIDCGIVYAMGKDLRAARLHGAFDTPSVAEIRTLIDGAPSNAAMLQALLRHLNARGFNCWGVDPNRGAIERLADAFDALATARTRPAAESGATPAEQASFEGSDESETAKTVREFNPRFAPFFADGKVLPGLGRELTDPSERAAYHAVLAEYNAAMEVAHRKDAARSIAESKLAIEKAERDGKGPQLRAVMQAVNQAIAEVRNAGKIAAGGRAAIDQGIAEYNAWKDRQNREGNSQSVESASAEWVERWTKHSDPKVALYFRSYFHLLLRPLREMAGLNKGNQQPRTKQFTDDLQEATRLGIQRTPAWPETPFADGQEADAAYSKLLSAVRSSIEGGPPAHQATKPAEQGISPAEQARNPIVVGDGTAEVEAPGRAKRAANFAQGHAQAGIAGPVDDAGVLDLVRLDEAAAIVHRSKKTLERRLTVMPAPYVQGGGGKPSLWKWAELRPWLEREYIPDLPATFPRNVR